MLSGVLCTQPARSSDFRRQQSWDWDWAAAQSALIGGLMGYALGSFGEGQERVNAENALLLLLGLSAIWLGCNAASKDIVDELAIYRRENDVNLSTAAFIGAKYLASSVSTVLQLAVVYVLVAALADGIG
jgi:hypothetical protein